MRRRAVVGLLAIAAAVVAIVAASTGVHLGEWMVHRLFSSGRG